MAPKIGSKPSGNQPIQGLCNNPKDVAPHTKIANTATSSKEIGNVGIQNSIGVKKS